MDKPRYKNIELVSCAAVEVDEYTKAKGEFEIIALFSLLDYGVKLKIPYLVRIERLEKK